MCKVGKNGRTSGQLNLGRLLPVYLFLQAGIYNPTPIRSLAKNIFYRKTSINSRPPHKFDHGFMLQTPEQFTLQPGENRKIDLQLMLKLPSFHIGQIVSPPLESELLVKPQTLSTRLSKVIIEVNNTTSKEQTYRRGKNIAFLVCIKCEEISDCMELRCAF